jgi:tight adherence protein C
MDMVALAAPLLVVSLMLAGVFTVVGLERRLARRDRFRRRLAMAARVGMQVGAGERTALFVVSELHGLWNRLSAGLGATHLLSQRDRNQIQTMLVHAGWRQREALRTYGTIKSVLTLTGVVLGLWLVFGAGLAGGQPVLQFGVVLVAAFAFGLLPEFFVRRVIARRRASITTHLPDALDLMVIAANAGQSLDVSLARVADEMRSHAPALGDELQVTISELRGLSDRRQPLENLARRTELAEVRSMTATLIQTLRYGTPLGASLKAIAQDMREARMLALEERAARLPALLSVPLMLFIAPAIFIVTAGPSVLLLMEVFAE